MSTNDSSAPNLDEIPSEYLETVVAQVALPVPRDQLVEALASHARSHQSLMRVRSIPLAYTPTYIEPLTALRWIENGGHSVE